jgi:antitoxin PrlF
VDAMAKVTSKGQVTLPKPVRDAIGLEKGDTVFFSVQDGYVVLAKIPNFLDLAGSVHVPPHLRGASWTKIRDETRRTRAAKWGKRSR